MNNIEYIQTVKETGNGYLVNGSLSVPKADGNRHYEDLKVWLETNTPEPEFTDEELAQQELQVKLQEAKFLLDSTQFKFGEDYDLKNTPEWLELKAKRQEAREFIRANS